MARTAFKPADLVTVIQCRGRKNETRYDGVVRGSKLCLVNGRHATLYAIDFEGSRPMAYGDEAGDGTFKGYLSSEMEKREFVS